MSTASVKRLERYLQSSVYKKNLKNPSLNRAERGQTRRVATGAPHGQVVAVVRVVGTVDNCRRVKVEAGRRSRSCFTSKRYRRTDGSRHAQIRRVHSIVIVIGAKARGAACTEAGHVDRAVFVCVSEWGWVGRRKLHTTITQTTTLSPSPWQTIKPAAACQTLAATWCVCVSRVAGSRCPCWRPGRPSSAS